jgi:hypothetical protein
MPSRPSTAGAPAFPGAAKRTRKTEPRHYKVTVSGVGAEFPVLLVLAKTQKAALDYVCRVSLATNEDLIAAGREEWSIVDLIGMTQRVDDAPVSGASE